MERPLKLWEFIVGLLGVTFMFGTLIYNRGTIDAKTEVRISNLEAGQRAQTQQYENLANKMDKVNENLNNILVIVQNKQDRKK